MRNKAKLSCLLSPGIPETSTSTTWGGVTLPPWWGGRLAGVRVRVALCRAAALWRARTWKAWRRRWPSRRPGQRSGRAWRSPNLARLQLLNLGERLFVPPFVRYRGRCPQCHSYQVIGEVLHPHVGVGLSLGAFGKLTVELSRQRCRPLPCPGVGASSRRRQPGRPGGSLAPRPVGTRSSGIRPATSVLPHLLPAGGPPCRAGRTWGRSG